eukprot:TRINITY_DN42301_c0_g1_i3.p1 TRINITY_DN42301_c0_g1~~TRINITY_DN42301_c0_g1_i3.p1  ORF type:complete len:364 (+),score=51.24 TRINITY_DN42301_c0_g1_i3:65-1156(+)
MMNARPPEFSCWDSIRNWQATTPVASRNWCYALIVGYVLSLLGAPYVFANCPNSVFKAYQFYRPFFAVFFYREWLGGLFGIISLFQIQSNIERQAGSLMAFLLPIVLTLLIQFTFLLITGVILALGGTAVRVFWFTCSVGCWPLIFAMMAYESSIAVEQSRRLWCFPIQIPVRIYPLILLLVFQLFLGVSLDLYVGITIGYLYSYTDGLKRFLSNDRLQRWEQDGKFAFLSRQPSFLSNTVAASYSVSRPPSDEESGWSFGGFSSLFSNSSNPTSSSASSSSYSRVPTASSSTSVFSSTRGYRLGAASASPASLPASGPLPSPVPLSSIHPAPAPPKPNDLRAHTPGSGHVLADRFDRTNQSQ